jgi:hypothetical protein
MAEIAEVFASCTVVRAESLEATVPKEEPGATLIREVDMAEAEIEGLGRILGFSTVRPWRSIESTLLVAAVHAESTLGAMLCGASERSVCIATGVTSKAPTGRWIGAVGMLMCMVELMLGLDVSTRNSGCGETRSTGSTILEVLLTNKVDEDERDEERRDGRLKYSVTT